MFESVAANDALVKSAESHVTDSDNCQSAEVPPTRLCSVTTPPDELAEM